MRQLGGGGGLAGAIDADNRNHGQPRRRLDVARAREALGFAAEVPLREGLAETVAAALRTGP